MIVSNNHLNYMGYRTVKRPRTPVTEPVSAHKKYVMGHNENQIKLLRCKRKIRYLNI